MAKRTIAVWPDGQWIDADRRPANSDPNFKTFELDYDPYVLEEEDDYINGYVQALVNTGAVTISVTQSEERTMNNEEFSVKPANQKFNICFHDNGKEVGKLTLEDGKLVFKGDVDASAEILFKDVCRRFNREAPGKG